MLGFRGPLCNYKGMFVVGERVPQYYYLNAEVHTVLRMIDEQIARREVT